MRLQSPSSRNITLIELLLRASLFPAALLGLLALPGLALKVIGDTLAFRLSFFDGGPSLIKRALSGAFSAMGWLLTAPAIPWVILADALEDRLEGRAAPMGQSALAELAMRLALAPAGALALAAAPGLALKVMGDTLAFRSGFYSGETTGLKGALARGLSMAGRALTAPAIPLVALLDALDDRVEAKAALATVESSAGLMEALMRAALLPAAALGVFALPGLALKVIVDSLWFRLSPASDGLAGFQRAIESVGGIVNLALTAPARPWVALSDALDDRAEIRAGRSRPNPAAMGQAR